MNKVFVFAISLLLSLGVFAKTEMRPKARDSFEILQIGVGLNRSCALTNKGVRCWGETMATAPPESLKFPPRELDANSRLEKLAAQRARLSEHIENLRSDSEVANSSGAAIKSLEERLVAFKRGVGRATPALKKRLLRSIYDVIFLNSNRLEGFYLTGGPYPGATPSSQKKKASGDSPEAFPKNSSKMWGSSPLEVGNAA